VKNPKKKRYKHKRIASPSKFARGSIRTKKLSGGKKLRVGCPKKKGKRTYNKKTGRCSVGTRAVSLLTPTRNPKKKAYAVIAVHKNRRYYLQEDRNKFETDKAGARPYTRGGALALAKDFSARYPGRTFGIFEL